MSTIEKRLRRSYTEILNVKPDDITDKSTIESIGADSLDDIELLMRVEDDFGIEIIESDWGDSETTFADRVDLITRIVEKGK